MLGRIEFYIDGDWVKPAEAGAIDVLNPATEEVIGAVGRGTAKDVDSAVKAARGAFPLFAATDKEERIALIERIIAIFEFGRVISRASSLRRWARQSPLPIRRRPLVRCNTSERPSTRCVAMRWSVQCTARLSCGSPLAFAA